MKGNELKQFLKTIWNELDYWCDQYKYANEVSHDQKELERISKNIRALEKVYNIYK